MKRLRFSEELVPLVIDGTKDTTWRVDDEKAIQPGDDLSLCRIDGTEFAKVNVVWTKETTFAQLTDEDIEGHEPFASDEEMLRTYSGYYNKPLDMKSRLKVIKFRIV